jgi:hypothetical protein
VLPSVRTTVAHAGMGGGYAKALNARWPGREHGLPSLLSSGLSRGTTSSSCSLDLAKQCSGGDARTASNASAAEDRPPCRRPVGRRRDERHQRRAPA